MNRVTVKCMVAFWIVCFLAQTYQVLDLTQTVTKLSDENITLAAAPIQTIIKELPGKTKTIIKTVYGPDKKKLRRAFEKTNDVEMEMMGVKDSSRPFGFPKKWLLETRWENFQKRNYPNIAEITELYITYTNDTGTPVINLIDVDGNQSSIWTGKEIIKDHNPHCITDHTNDAKLWSVSGLSPY